MYFDLEEKHFNRSVHQDRSKKNVVNYPQGGIRSIETGKTKYQIQIPIIKKRGQLKDMQSL